MKNSGSLYAGYYCIWTTSEINLAGQLSMQIFLKAETHDATNRGDKSPRLHCCCDKSLALSLSLRYVTQIQTSFNLCDRSQRQWFSHVTRGDLLQQPVAATCRSDLLHRVSRPLELGRSIGSSMVSHNYPHNQSFNFPAQFYSKITVVFFAPFI